MEISHLLGDSFTLLNLKDVNIKEEIPEDYPTLKKMRYSKQSTSIR